VKLEFKVSPAAAAGELGRSAAEGVQVAVTVDEFWDSNYYDHPPLTDEMVAEAERQLDVKLPTEYLALLRVQNGGYTRGFGYPMSRPTTWADDHVPLGALSGIVLDPNHSTALNILHTQYLTREWDLPPRQVLLNGDGHWWISLDYRAGEIPTVAWLAIDSGEDFQIAPSFASFLAGLLPNSAFADDEGAEQDAAPDQGGE
jgi:hypothetical protein